MKIQFLTFFLFFTFYTANSLTLTVSVEIEADTPLFTKAQLLVDEIAAEMEADVQITLKTMGLKRSQHELTKGNTDGDLGRAKNAYQDNEQVVLINIPILYQNIVCYSKKDIAITGPASIRNFTILHNRDALAVEDLLKKHSLSSSGVLNEVMAFRMLKGDRADIYIGTSLHKDLLSTPTFKNSGIKMLTPPLMSFPLYLFLNKKYQNIVQDFEQAIKKIIDSGRVKEIFGQSQKFTPGFFKLKVMNQIVTNAPTSADELQYSISIFRILFLHNENFSYELLY